MSEDKNEQVYDGDGRPVMEKTGHRTYHIDSVPSGELVAEVRAYQVWSTVLGKALTEVSPSGAKISTSVYAGGTHIAKQTENGVEWSTADPVTGTVGKFVFTGQGSATDVENTEPLGQKIHPHDPAEYTPPTGTVMIGNADYPEWQCEAQNAFILYGEFQEWPMPCRQR